MGTSARRQVLMNDEHMTNRTCIYGHQSWFTSSRHWAPTSKATMPVKAGLSTHLPVGVGVGVGVGVNMQFTRV